MEFLCKSSSNLLPSQIIWKTTINMKINLKMLMRWNHCLSFSWMNIVIFGVYWCQSQWMYMNKKTKHAILKFAQLILNAKRCASSYEISLHPCSFLERMAYTSKSTLMYHLQLLYIITLESCSHMHLEMLREKLNPIHAWLKSY